MAGKGVVIKIPFGRTGQVSARIIFGAAALSAMRQERADQVLETLLEYGVNHIDVAAIYGDAELRVGAWMKTYRKHFFIATKTIERTGPAVREGILRSLERLRIERLDLIQFHNLCEEKDWEIAMGPGGALEAAIAARDEGLVRFIGVTGHGTQTANMHLRSVRQFPFDSVLLPYNYMMMQDPIYAADFEALLTHCKNENIAVQTIKAMARRRWPSSAPARRFSWYEPLTDNRAVEQTVHWVLSRPGVFLNSSSDASILRSTLDAATRFDAAQSAADTSMPALAKEFAIEPLFVKGQDGI